MNETSGVQRESCCLPTRTDSVVHQHRLPKSSERGNAREGHVMNQDAILRVRTGDVVNIDAGQREKREQAEETINYPSDWRERRGSHRVSA